MVVIVSEPCTSIFRVPAGFTIFLLPGGETKFISMWKYQVSRRHVFLYGIIIIIIFFVILILSIQEIFMTLFSPHL